MRKHKIPIHRLRYFATGRHIWSDDPGAYGSVEVMSQETGESPETIHAAIQLTADLVREYDEDNGR